MISLHIPGLAQAIHHHRSFVESLHLKINGKAGEPVNAAALTRYAHGLGPWLYAHAMIAYAEITQLREVEELHAGIHKLAAQINLLISEQNNMEAKAVYEQLLALNNELTRKLDEILQLPEMHQETLNFTPEVLKIDKQALFEKQQQILMQQQQQSLLDAIEVAQLGTWTMDVATQKATFSQRHLSMFGVNAKDMNLEAAINHVVESERAQLVNAFFDALKPGSDGKFEAEYTIIHGKTGNAHIIHTKGQTNYNSSGKAVSISGIAQDVTLLRTQQQSLEALVELRTKELDASNKKLAEGNQRLQQANLLLRRSNEDLNRFAYVASHDLQEPLRKIQQFGSRLMAEFETTSPKGKDYLSRMSAAAGRMSSLINDLLTFSRVSISEVPAELASLKRIVEQVLADLEVQISQADARFEIGPLPDVPGNTTHLTQLFQNLVSNAIKFRKVDGDGNFIPPTIKIHSHRIAHEDLPEAQQSLAADTHYFRIDISDDGIGFDTVYLDRIFQVFQRLHGRSEYTGTGIGLAICERIVVNMGGMITAISSPGNGSTFQIYLPDSQ
ncbi:sensor histidine kinase [Dyadobacter sp.]|uniref:sensor histidine kinase n=1 Tax=Dyadobacter sp. TaxID=1914288 RepID=UPI003F6FD87A